MDDFMVMCKKCGSQDVTLIGTVVNYGAGTKTVLKCNLCGLVEEFSVKAVSYVDLMIELNGGASK